ncbi:MAG: M55 family metallopeptidase, partial [Armatimonadota bacterium]
NAALCGHFGCPVVMVSGDEATCREGRELLGGGATMVAVKRGLGRFSARNFPVERARAAIEEGARLGIERRAGCRPYVPARPTRITVEVDTVDRMAPFLGKPGVEATCELRVVATGADWMAAWDRIWPQGDLA